jgi:hypothetical protein
MNQVIKTADGYMVLMSNEDYACDAQGDNTWDTFNEAREVLCTLTVTKQEETARIFGQHYAYVHPSYTKHWERKEIATTLRSLSLGMHSFGAWNDMSNSLSLTRVLRLTFEVCLSD